MKEESILLMGLPGTGKSTFLGALWFAAEESSHATVLGVDELESNIEQLNTLRDKWLACEEPGRTLGSGEGVLKMRLIDRKLDVGATVQFPDLAGERFEAQWWDRQCEQGYKDIAETCSSVLVFVNPNTLQQGLLILDVDAAVGAAKANDSKNGKADPPKERTSETDPTAVILVDLLQLLVMPPFSPRKLKIGLVISAWDAVEQLQQEGAEPKEGPEGWATRRLPFLMQFLRTNPEWLKFRVFGISAQGGDYDKIKSELLQRTPQIERIKVVFGSETATDPTLPVKWLME